MGKGLEAFEKDNYRGITLFPVIIKVFEVIFLRGLENFAKEKGYFSIFSLAFLPVLAVERLPLLLWRPLIILKKGRGKFFACFLDVRKAFDTVCIDGLLHRLFSVLGVEGKMFAMIKTLCIDVESFVYFDDVSAQAFPLYKGSGHGRILAPFM